MAAPVLSESSYSLDAPPLKTPTTVRAMWKLYHPLLASLPVIVNSEPVRFIIRQKDIAFVRLYRGSVTDKSLRAMAFIFHDADDGNHHAGFR